MVDPKTGEQVPLYKTEALYRSKLVRNPYYMIALSLLPGGLNFEGQVIVNFDLSLVSSDIFLDFEGSKVLSIVVNGKEAMFPDLFSEHKIKLPVELLKEGRNQAQVRFTGTYVRDCQGLHYFKDPEDQNEYLYSNVEPFDAHKIFPCFD